MPTSQCNAARWWSMAAMVLLCASAALAQGHTGFVDKEMATLSYLLTNYPTTNLVLLGIPALCGYYLLVLRRTRHDRLHWEQNSPPQPSVPEGMSPLKMTTVTESGTVARDLTAAILRLAIKGYCIIHEPAIQASTNEIVYHISRRNDLIRYPYQTIIADLAVMQTVSFRQLSGRFAQPEPRIREMVDYLGQEGVIFEITEDELRMTGVTESFTALPYGVSKEEIFLLGHLFSMGPDRTFTNRRFEQRVTPLIVPGPNGSMGVLQSLWIARVTIWNSVQTLLYQTRLGYLLPGVLFAALAIWDIIRIFLPYLVTINIDYLSLSILMTGLPLFLFAGIADSLLTGPFSGDTTSRVISWVQLILSTLFLGGLVVFGNILYYVLPFCLYLIIAAYIAVIASFRPKLIALNEQGQRLRREIAGFRQYLNLPSDQLDLPGQPERTIAQFEAYLPYAFALSVEDGWYRKFADLVGNPDEPDGYRPDWYEGTDWRIFIANGFVAMPEHYVEEYPSWICSKR